MSEMVERVARAMFDKYVADGGGQGKLDEMSNGTQEMYRSMAQAAIQAMREPTEAMVLDGDVAADCYDRTGPHADAIWPAMIDAALKPDA